MNFYVCQFDFNDSFAVLTIIVRKQFIFQHESHFKKGIFQSHPNNYVVGNSCIESECKYRIRIQNAIQVSKCLMYTVSNIGILL